jgi:anti-anti-sigma factor
VAAVEEIQPFSISVNRTEDRVVLAVGGELDLATAPELRTALADQTRTDQRTCLDLAGCTFIDSTGLQVIVSAARDFRRDGGELSVTQLRGDVAELFRISGLLLEGSALAYREQP